MQNSVAKVIVMVKFKVIVMSSMAKCKGAIQLIYRIFMCKYFQMPILS